MNKLNKVAFFLWALCAVLGVAFDMTMGLHKQFRNVTDEFNYTIIQLSTAGFVFLPLLFLTRYYTKKAQMKKLTVLATTLIVFFFLWIVITLIKLAFNL